MKKSLFVSSVCLLLCFSLFACQTPVSTVSDPLTNASAPNSTVTAPETSPVTEPVTEPVPEPETPPVTEPETPPVTEPEPEPETPPAPWVIQKTPVIRLDGSGGAPTVPDVLSWDDIEALPLAVNQMTTTERRQLVLDFFRLQQSFRWTLNQTFSYQINASRPVTLSPGTIYGGLPYRDGTGNIYVVMDFYDPDTGRLMVPVGTEQQQAFARIISNHCSYGAFWAWTRVCSSVRFHLTPTIVPDNGCGALSIGEYSINVTQNWSSSNKSKTVATTNGQQVMYRSYAELLPADGMIMNNGSGHVQIVSARPVVVKNRDGTINGDESYVLYLDQGSTWNVYTYPDGTKATLQGELDFKITFRQMYNSGYLPFTLAELIGTKSVDASTVSFSYEGYEGSYAALTRSTLTTNYPVSTLKAYIIEQNGDLVQQNTLYYNPRNNVEIMYGDKGDFSFAELLAPLAFYQDYGVQIRIDAFLSTGENYTLFQGPFVP